MSETGRGPPTETQASARPLSGDVGIKAGPTRAGEPAAPGAFAGRARAFRQEQTKRRTTRREHVVDVLLVIAIVVGAYVIVTEPPYSPNNGNTGVTTPSGPPIVVHFGTPTESSVTCGAGGTAYTESIPWTNSTRPVATGEVYVRVYEIWDGDYIPDPNVVANATPTNLCAGSPPDASALWYVVLAAPNGTNLLTYTQANAWTSVSQGATNLVIQNDSALILVTASSLAGTGRGFEVIGFVGGSQISGSVPL
jgi:hypothetical protein